METELKKFDTIGVIGLGFLGKGIAASLVGTGFHVIAVEPGQGAQKQAYCYIEDALQEMVRNGVTVHLSNSWADRFSVSDSIQSLKACQFIIESVVEDLDLKSRVFDEVETFVPAEVPIATNTSAIPITILQRGRKYPSRFLGMHWAEPAYATRFMEIIRGDSTSDAALQAATELARRIGKDPCLVNHDIPGFIVNRLGYAMYREAAHLLELGIADVATIDRAFRNACGLWATFCGPFRWIDITGGPAFYAKAMRQVLPTLCNRADLPAVFVEKELLGERGVIDGHGFYSYTQDDAGYWQALLHEHAWEVRRLQEHYYPAGDDK